MRDTLRATGLKTKREAVDQALRTLPRLRRQREIRRLRGKLDWQCDLNQVASSLFFARTCGGAFRWPVRFRQACFTGWADLFLRGIGWQDSA
jgi:hypothetical protein